MVSKPHFNRQEKAILKVLYEERRNLSLREIAEKTHMSWVTVRKYVDQLTKKGWIQGDLKLKRPGRK